MLHTFGVKVHVFPDRVEVRGSIPTQVPELSEPEPEPAETPLLLPVRLPHLGEGEKCMEGLRTSKASRSGNPALLIPVRITRSFLGSLRGKPLFEAPSS